MPVLPNPKHEAFAQELAKGKSQAEAYQTAGYKPSEPHASRLASNGKVVDRVAELLTKAAERTLVTVESLTQELEAIRVVAVAEKQTSAAVSAVMGKAKLHGLLVDKLEADITHHLTDLSDEELEREIAITLSEPQQTAH